MYHRVGFTAAQSAELWERWKKGEGLKSMGRAPNEFVPPSPARGLGPTICQTGNERQQAVMSSSWTECSGSPTSEPLL